MSAWIQHVKRFQEANGCSYKDALKHAGATYLKGSGYGKFDPDNIQYHTTGGTFKTFAKQQEKNVKRQAKKRLIDAIEDKAESLLGMGAVGQMLKESAAGNVVRLLDSGTDRATRAMSGGNIQKATKKQLIKIIEVLGDKGADYLSGMGMTGDMLKRSAAGNVVRLLDSGTDRATRAMSGSSVNRFKKANRWQTFVDTTIRDTIDTGAKGAKAYYNATSPMEQMGFGLKRHKRLSGRALLAAGY